MSENISYTRETKAFSRSILIVEDDDDTRLMLRYLLEIWNFRVIEAVTGEEALTLAKTHQPDVVLMDYRLPQIDGVTATKALRSTSSLEKLVIIFVSAHSGEDVRASALAAGANDYLVKPIDFGKLEIALETHLRSGANRIQTPVKSV